MKNKTKKIIKRTGIVLIGVTGFIMGYKIGKSVGYDKGIFDVLSDFADKGYIKKVDFKS